MVVSVCSDFMETKSEVEPIFLGCCAQNYWLSLDEGKPPSSGRGKGHPFPTLAQYVISTLGPQRETALSSLEGAGIIGRAPGGSLGSQKKWQGTTDWAAGHMLLTSFSELRLFIFWYRNWNSGPHACPRYYTTELPRQPQNRDF